MAKKNKYLSDKGHLMDEYIALYIDAQLIHRVKELPTEILSHVEDCTTCKQKIIDGYETLKDNHDINMENHPYFGSKKRSVQELKKPGFLVFYRVAAFICVLIGLGFIAYYVLKPKSFSKLSEQLKNKTAVLDSNKKKDMISDFKKDSISTDKKTNTKIKDELIVSDIKKKDLITQNIIERKEFKISPIMISMLGTQTRSAFFELEFPLDSTVFNKNSPIKFKWDSDIKEDITLKVFNYKDSLVFESDILKSNDYELNKTLTSGAFIWKIEGADDIYHLGLLFVNN